jgi:Asp-tRNA(Asn)/Glu-tRNA(Gln) amidotransferase A subunit family amidase
VGFKGTYGLLSTRGILEGEQADEFILLMSHTAFTCRTVNDAAILLNALANPDVSTSAFKSDYPAFGGTKNPRIGVAKNFKATDPVQTVFLNAVGSYNEFCVN